MMLICFCLTLQLLNSETEHITEWLTRRSIFQPPKRVRKIGHLGFSTVNMKTGKEII